MGSRVAAGGEATKPSKSRELNSAYHLGISYYPGKLSGLRFGARAGGGWRAIEEHLRRTTMCTSVVSYADQGFTVFGPTAASGAVSLVATIMPLAAAVAAM